MNRSESTLLPLLNGCPDAQSLYVMYLLAAENVTPGNPAAFDQGYLSMVGMEINELIATSPLRSARVLTALLTALAVADRTIAEVAP